MLCAGCICNTSAVLCYALASSGAVLAWLQAAVVVCCSATRTPGRCHVARMSSRRWVKKVEHMAEWPTCDAMVSMNEFSAEAFTTSGPLCARRGQHKQCFACRIFF